jgi:hypothetical protein
VPAVPDALRSALASGAWRHPGWPALREMLCVPADACELELFPSLAHMQRVKDQVRAAFLPLPWFRIVERDKPDDSYLALEHALFVGGSVVPGEDVLLVVDLEGPDQVWWNWSREGRDLPWRPLAPFAHLLDALASR